MVTYRDDRVPGETQPEQSDAPRDGAAQSGAERRPILWPGRYATRIIHASDPPARPPARKVPE